jgi:ABC-type branched-subunit amino acid transport system substrate-binding protein
MKHSFARFSGLRFPLLAGVLAITLAACSTDPVRKTYTPYAEPKADATKTDFLKTVQAAYQSGDFYKVVTLTDTNPEEKVRPGERAEIYNVRGLALLAQKKSAQSEEAFRKSLSYNQNSQYDGYFQYNIATALYEGDKQNDALAELNKIDMHSLDQSHQNQVLALKQKIISPSSFPPSLTPNADHANSATDNLGSPAVMPVTGETVIATPTEVYHGETNSNRIGVLLPLTGKYEAFGEKAKKAIELAFNQTESHTYELVTEDSGDTPESNVAALQKLVEQDKVIAVLGPLLSKGIDQLTTKAEYYQVPLVSMAAVQGPIATDLFSCSISSHDQASRIVEYAMKNKGFRKFAIMAPSNKGGEELAQAFWDEVEARKGEVKEFELYDPNDTDFRKEVDRIIGLGYPDARAKELDELAIQRKEMNITRKTMKTAQYFELPPIIDFDAVFIADEAKIAGEIIPTFAFRNANKIPFLGISTWNSPQLIQRAGEAVDGAAFPVGFNTLSPSDSTQKFYDLYHTAYESSPGEFEAIAFDAAKLVLNALKQSPSSRDDFRKQLENNSPIEGGTGEFSVENHRCTRKLALYGVEKGKFVALDDTKIDSP